MRKNDNLLDCRGHGEKRCKRRLREKSTDGWKQALYKEGSSPPLCLTRITFRTTRTTHDHAYDDGSLPPGLRPIDTLLFYSTRSKFKVKFKYKYHIYIYRSSLQ